MINSRQKVFESIFHISFSATVNYGRGNPFFIEEEKKESKIQKPDLNWINK